MKHQQLNEKEAALHAKLMLLLNWRKGLKSSKRRFGHQNRLIAAEEALIVHSLKEAEGLEAELKTDLVKIRVLNTQLVDLV